MSSVHLITCQQAACLDLAMRTRRSDEPFPACPVCGVVPTEVSWSSSRLENWMENWMEFADCGHRVTVDMDSWADWCAAGNAGDPVVLMTEEAWRR